MNYTMLSSSQNRFILFDFLDEEMGSFAHMHALLLETDRDDALILSDYELSNGELFVKISVLGQDGLFGEFCANGACAISKYLHDKYSDLEKIFLKTSWGNLLLRHDNMGSYSVKIPLPRTSLNSKFIGGPFEDTPFCYIEAIEPHLTINMELADDALFALGKALNYNRGLFPLGINVNAWHRLDEKRLFVKTYERGVQRLTKSCGTGSISSAFAAHAKGKVEVTTPGGTLLLVFEDDGVTLSGSCQLDN